MTRSFERSAIGKLMREAERFAPSFRSRPEELRTDIVLCGAPSFTGNLLELQRSYEFRNGRCSGTGQRECARNIALIERIIAHEVECVLLNFGMLETGTIRSSGNIVRVIQQKQQAAA